MKHRKPGVIKRDDLVVVSAAKTTPCKREMFAEAEPGLWASRLSIISLSAGLQTDPRFCSSQVTRCSHIMVRPQWEALRPLAMGQRTVTAMNPNANPKREPLSFWRGDPITAWWRKGPSTPPALLSEEQNSAREIYNVRIITQPQLMLTILNVREL